MGRRGRFGRVIAVLPWIALVVGGTADAAVNPKPACSLVSRAALTRILGLPRMAATPSSESAVQPDGFGAALTECKIEAWRGARSSAGLAHGTLAHVTITAAEEALPNPTETDWGAIPKLAKTEEGVLDRAQRHLHYELWDDAPAQGYGFGDSVSQGAEAVWSGRPGGTEHAFEEEGPPKWPTREVYIVVVAGKGKPAVRYLNRIAAVAVPSFAVTPGEFDAGEHSAPPSGVSGGGGGGR